MQISRISMWTLQALIALPLATAGAQVSDWPVHEITVDATSDEAFAYIDLSNGTATDSTGNWDIAIRRFEIRLADGVGAATVFDNTGPAQIDPTGEMVAQGVPAFEAISADGIPEDDRFVATFPSSIDPVDSPPFLYGRDPGDQHRVTPTFNIYLVRRDDAVHAVQFISYYHPESGAPRFITLRSRRVR